MYQLTITLYSIDDLQRLVNQLAELADDPLTRVAPTASVEVVDDPFTRAAPTASVEPPPPEPEQPKAPTYDDAAQALLALVRAKGRDAAVAALARVGAKHLSEVPPERYADLISECKQ